MGSWHDSSPTHPQSRILVSPITRDTCDLVANKLGKVEGAKVSKLVGQSDRKGEKGLRQKEQVECCSASGTGSSMCWWRRP